jgi:hypothetical protein
MRRGQVVHEGFADPASTSWRPSPPTRAMQDPADDQDDGGGEGDAHREAADRCLPGCGSGNDKTPPVDARDDDGRSVSTHCLSVVRCPLSVVRCPLCVAVGCLRAHQRAERRCRPIGRRDPWAHRESRGPAVHGLFIGNSNRCRTVRCTGVSVPSAGAHGGRAGDHPGLGSHLPKQVVVPDGALTTVLSTGWLAQLTFHSSMSDEAARGAE